MNWFFQVLKVKNHHNEPNGFAFFALWPCTTVKVKLCKCFHETEKGAINCPEAQKARLNYDWANGEIELNAKAQPSDLIRPDILENLLKIGLYGTTTKEIHECLMNRMVEKLIISGALEKVEDYFHTLDIKKAFNEVDQQDKKS